LAESESKGTAAAIAHAQVLASTAETQHELAAAHQQTQGQLALKQAQLLAAEEKAAMLTTELARAKLASDTLSATVESLTETRTRLQHQITAFTESDKNLRSESQSIIDGLNGEIETLKGSLLEQVTSPFCYFFSPRNAQTCMGEQANYLKQYMKEEQQYMREKDDEIRVHKEVLPGFVLQNDALLIIFSLSYQNLNTAQESNVKYKQQVTSLREEVFRCSKGDGLVFRPLNRFLCVQILAQQKATDDALQGLSQATQDHEAAMVQERADHATVMEMMQTLVDEYVTNETLVRVELAACQEQYVTVVARLRANDTVGLPRAGWRSSAGRLTRKWQPCGHSRRR
jgi:hypothetical protein